MNLDLKPTYENIIKTIKDDVLGRNDILKRFVKILYFIKDANIISLNGEWGSGKTFFVHQAMHIIKNLNCSEAEVDPNLEKFINEFKFTQLSDINTASELYPIYYNAWEYDSNEDPLLTLIYSIIDQNPKLKEMEEKSETIQEKISRIISNFKIGISYQSNYGITAGIDLQYNPKEHTKLTKDVYSVEEVKHTFKELLSEIMIEKTNKLVIFVDELDRCNPIFAVKLLERIKHFFDDDRFIFVFSTNLNELQYTIKKFYGEGINGYQYLDKFFDLQFSLSNINRENYIRYLNVINTLSGDYFDVCSMAICIQFNFSLRQINRFYNLINLVYDYISNRDIMYYNEVSLSKHILFPIMLGIKIYDINIYNKIIRGEGEYELKEIIIKNRELVNAFNSFFKVGQNKNELLFNFSELYRKIFIEIQENEWTEVEIGKITIKHGKERKLLMVLLSFLNGFVQIKE